MIRMAALCMGEYGLAGFEMMPDQDAGLLKLCQNAINRRKTNFHAFTKQNFIRVCRCQMTHIAVLEQIEDLQARQSRLQPDGLQIVRGGHDGTDRKAASELS